MGPGYVLAGFTANLSWKFATQKWWQTGKRLGHLWNDCCLIWKFRVWRRLFYHNSNSSIMSRVNSVRELIWDKNKEKWSPGASFHAYPKFRLLQLLIRALRSYDAPTLLEGGRCNILGTLGPSLENYLIHSSADIAAISYDGDTYFYSYSATASPNLTNSTSQLPLPA